MVGGWLRRRGGLLLLLLLLGGHGPRVLPGGHRRWRRTRRRKRSRLRGWRGRSRWEGALGGGRGARHEGRLADRRRCRGERGLAWREGLLWLGHRGGGSLAGWRHGTRVGGSRVGLLSGGRRRRRRGELLLRGRGVRRVEWLLRRRRGASVVLLRSCRAAGRWWLDRGRGGGGGRGLGVRGRRGSGVSGAGRRLRAVRWSVSGPGGGRRPGVDLHPGHLVGDLLHRGRGPVVLGVGGLLPRQVHSSLAVWLRRSRPGWRLCHERGSVLHTRLTVTVLIIWLRC